MDGIVLFNGELYALGDPLPRVRILAGKRHEETDELIAGLAPCGIRCGSRRGWYDFGCSSMFRSAGGRCCRKYRPDAGVKRSPGDGIGGCAQVRSIAVDEECPGHDKRVELAGCAIVEGGGISDQGGQPGSASRLRIAEEVGDARHAVGS